MRNSNALIGRVAAAFMLIAGGASMPAASHAQTLDHGVGEQPSRDLSVPPGAPRINRLGAMRKAYSPRDQHAQASQTQGGSQPSTAGRPQ